MIVPYIYFSIRTGKGESGSAVLIVTSDAGGAANASATFAMDVKAVGTPVEFDYLTETQAAQDAKSCQGVTDKPNTAPVSLWQGRIL